MSDYFIQVEGCDDTTAVIVPLDESGVEALRRVIERVNATASYTCMPTMSMRPASDDDVESAE